MSVAAMVDEESAEQSRSISGRLADFAHDLRPEDIPSGVKARARHLILDAVGAALPATRSPFAAAMRQGLLAMGEGGDGSVIGLPDRLPVRDAATLNAALIHGLDFDDTHMKSVVHATAVSFPAALAVGEQVNAAGPEILTAYVIAMETAIRIGLAADYGFHRNGYHGTGVVGHFASALAAGRLLGLGREALAHAQGLMTSTASGSREYFEDGSWNKRLHPGWAAVAGITAANLARAGFEGAERAYDGRFGLFRLHMVGETESMDFSALTEGLGSRWHLMEVAVKPFPSCHYTHALADSALALRRTHGFSWREIAGIEILMPGEVMKVLSEPDALKKRPPTDYAAKFSAPYVVSASLARGRFGLAEMAPDALSDPATLALCDLCEPKLDPESRFPEFFSGGVVVTLRDGRRLRHHEPVNRGAGERRLTDAEVIAKFLDNAAPVVGAADARRIRDLVLSLDDIDGRALAAGLAGGA